MATLIDPNDELSSDSLEQEVTQTTPEVKAEEKTPEVPEKYRGKSLDDIVRMHQEAEKLIGKQAQEVGEVRKLADELLRQQLSSKVKEPEPSQEDEVDFFADPKEAVKRAVENHPSVKKANEVEQRFKAMDTVQKLQERHPDFQTVTNSPEFAEWVKASKVRTNLYLEAHNNFDLDSADELLSTFKQLRSVSQARQETQAAKEADVTRQRDLKAASVDVGGTGEVAKKVYRRADLIRLKMQDPDRYNAMQDEIYAAYSEGRVK
jgi:hypothetical protein